MNQWLSVPNISKQYPVTSTSLTSGGGVEAIPADPAGGVVGSNPPGRRNPEEELQRNPEEKAVQCLPVNGDVFASDMFAFLRPCNARADVCLKEGTCSVQCRNSCSVHGPWMFLVNLFQQSQYGVRSMEVWGCPEHPITGWD